MRFPKNVGEETVKPKKPDSLLGISSNPQRLLSCLKFFRGPVEKMKKEMEITILGHIKGL